MVLVAYKGMLIKENELCKTVVFYSHGMDKKRLSNKHFNNLYQLLEKISATHSDFNWFLNINMKNVRLKQGNKEKTLFWIPASIPIKTIPRKENVFNHRLVFLGVLSNKNGADLLPKIILNLKKKVQDVTLDIIGEGELSISIRDEVKKLRLEKSIKLHGLLKFKDFSPMMTHYSIGMAPYENDFETLSSSSDPMKMRIYLAAGLPVIITKGFNFSDEIAKHNLGYAVTFKVESFVKATLKLLKNKELNLSIRKRALAYSKEYDIINIYDRTFQEIFMQLEKNG